MVGRTEALFGLNGGKAEGRRGGEGDAPAVGEQDNTTASHMWARGGEGGRQGCGGCTQWHCYKGGVGGMQLIRLREMDHSLKSSPWEALTQNTPVTVWLLKLGEFKKGPQKSFKSLKRTVDQSYTNVFILLHEGERKYVFLGT